MRTSTSWRLIHGIFDNCQRPKGALNRIAHSGQLPHRVVLYHVAMITGIHLITYAKDADKARAFFKDVLGLPSVDAGRGWLIFALPPAEIAAHPTDAADSEQAASAGGQPRCELYLMCDDVKRTIDDLKRKGVEFTSPVSEQPWGLLTTLRVPGAGEIGLYQPKHPIALGLK
jgi:predicted enzyme related to lactoylglutathione lyase